MTCTALVFCFEACKPNLDVSQAQYIIAQTQWNVPLSYTFTLTDTPEMRKAIEDLRNSGHIQSTTPLGSWFNMVNGNKNNQNSGTANYNGFYHEFNVVCPLYLQHPTVVRVRNDSKNGLAIATVRYDLIPNQPFYQRICVEGKADVKSLPSRGSITREITFQHFDRGWQMGE